MSMPETRAADTGGLMRGKRGLVMGVANDHSIAWGIAKALYEQGAELALTYQDEALGKRVQPLAESLGAALILRCDVEDAASIDAVFLSMRTYALAIVARKPAMRRTEARLAPPVRAARTIARPGAVRVDPMFQAPDPARVVGASVTFEPGARTAWHTHPLGQTLIVTAGCGWVQREGGPVEEITRRCRLVSARREALAWRDANHGDDAHRRSDVTLRRDAVFDWALNSNGSNDSAPSCRMREIADIPGGGKHYRQAM
jgi:hypothetical protein